MSANKRFILNVEPDRFYDYCHFEYKPGNVPKDKLRSADLLIHSFKSAKCGKQFYDFIDILRQKFGVNNTVWGIKKNDENPAWEFYFYNPEKKDSRINISNFIKVSKKFFSADMKVNENVPYFMFSVDITKKLFKSKKLQGLHVYVDNSYFLDKTGMTLENQYSFYQPKREKKGLVFDIKKSAIIDFTKIKLSEILWSRLIDCYSICRSHKRKNDAIYYSRINIDQFIIFLKKLNYPNKLISFIEKNKQKLNHLYYDVGFDYSMENNKLKIIKSGYYGTF